MLLIKATYLLTLLVVTKTVSR